MNLRDLLNLRKNFCKNQKHSFHIVTPSIWPLFGAFSVLVCAVGLVMFMHFYTFGFSLFCYGLFLVICVMVFWWRDVIRESTFLGYHGLVVQRGMRLGIVLFIISEIMFFFGFFWAFFHSSLVVSPVLGAVWPPVGIFVLNPIGVPLLNTVILLTSGITVTCSHYALRLGHVFVGLVSLVFTIVLAIEFTCWQIFEYYSAVFYISDGIYGSTFYLLTGFHGFHVIIGTLFLCVCLVRLFLGHFSSSHHIGFEGAIWY